MSDVHRNISGADAHRFAPAAADEDHVYGACAPGWHTAAAHGDALDDWVAFMERCGVARVCCLLAGRCPDGAADNLKRYRRAFGADAVLHAPTLDRRLVDRDLLAEEVVPFLDDAVAAGERTVVHCLSGTGRTGQVLAVWLAHDRGYGPERALETVRETGRLPAAAVGAGHATEAQLHELVGAFG